MLKYLVAAFLSLVFSFAANAQDFPQPKTAEFKLAIALSRCVDVRASSIDPKCLKADFFPLLGLRKADRVVKGEFYYNTEGRGFSLTIEKRSTSGATIALFDLYVDLVRDVYVANDSRFTYATPYDISNGIVYGNIPANDSMVVDIYELGRGDYLAGDSDLRVIASMDGTFENSKMPKPSSVRELRDVLQSGKTVGQILEERMASLEKAGLGGEKYRKESIWRSKPVFPRRPGVIVPEVIF